MHNVLLQFLHSHPFTAAASSVPMLHKKTREEFSAATKRALAGIESGGVVVVDAALITVYARP
jgi:hypothetical protein